MDNWTVLSITVESQWTTLMGGPLSPVGLGLSYINVKLRWKLCVSVHANAKVLREADDSSEYFLCS